MFITIFGAPHRRVSFGTRDVVALPLPREQLGALGIPQLLKYVTALLSRLAVWDPPQAVPPLAHNRGRIHSQFFHTTGDH